MSGDTNARRRPKQPVRSILAPTDSPTNEAAEILERAGQSLTHIGSECVAIVSDDIVAMIESSEHMVRLFADVAQCYVDACNQLGQAFVDIGQGAISSKSPDDLIHLQGLMRDGLNTSVSATGKMYFGAFDAWSRVMTPFVARLADGPQRLFHAVANRS